MRYKRKINNKDSVYQETYQYTINNVGNSRVFLRVNSFNHVKSDGFIPKGTNWRVS